MLRCTLAFIVLSLGATVLSFAADDAKESKKKAVDKESPKPLRPVNLSINTKADEDEPLAVGNTLYYSSNEGGKYRIRMATRLNPVANWAKPQTIVDNFDTEEEKSAYFVSERTGFQYLFFATLRDKDAKNFDIYVVQRNDPRKTWSAITAVQSVSTPEDEMHPWITADRKTMYFSRKTKDGWRVCSVTRPTANGPQFQGEAKVVEDIPAGFAHATLTPDGKTMYLHGPLSDGRWGLFVSTKVGTKWGKPEALELLNSPEAPTGDRSPSLSADGMVLYFASDRAGGKGGVDLWMITTNQLGKKR